MQNSRRERSDDGGDAEWRFERQQFQVGALHQVLQAERAIALEVVSVEWGHDGRLVVWVPFLREHAVNVTDRLKRILEVLEAVARNHKLEVLLGKWQS